MNSTCVIWTLWQQTQIKTEIKNMILHWSFWKIQLDLQGKLEQSQKMSTDQNLF